MSVDHVLPYRATPIVPIIFTEEDFQGLDVNQDNPMVVRVIIVNFEVRKVLIDQESLADILFADAFNKTRSIGEADFPIPEHFSKIRR